MNRLSTFIATAAPAAVLAIDRRLARSFIVFAIAMSVGSAAAHALEHATVDGYKLAFVQAGQGEALVLVHGGLQDYRFWSDLMPTLAQRYRVISYSRRNHFPNEVSVEGAPDGAADRHADDLAALVRELKLGKVRVVGHSSGALAALFFARRHPALVRSLVLNEPPVRSLIAATPEGPALLKEQGGRMAPAREAFIAGDFERAVPLFVDAVGGPGAFQRRSAAAKRMALDNTISSRAEFIAKQPRPSFVCDDAKAIAVPVLLTTGERSPPFFKRIVAELERCLPQARRHTIAGASHTVPAEQPALFAEAVTAFFAQH